MIIELEKRPVIPSLANLSGARAARKANRAIRTFLIILQFNTFFLNRQERKSDNIIWKMITPSLSLQK